MSRRPPLADFDKLLQEQMSRMRDIELAMKAVQYAIDAVPDPLAYAVDIIRHLLVIIQATARDEATR